MKNVTAQAV